MDSDQVSHLYSRFAEVLEIGRQLYRPLIVMWGPGPHDHVGYRKKRRLRQAILEEIPGANGVFPEDPQVVDVTSDFVRDLDRQESLQVLAADIVIALDIAEGVAQEVARYSRSLAISKKLFVISSENRRKGYSAVIRGALDVKYLSETELMECQEASSYCVEKVRAWLVERLCERGLGGI